MKDSNSRQRRQILDKIGSFFGSLFSIDDRKNDVKKEDIALSDYGEWPWQVSLRVKEFPGSDGQAILGDRQVILTNSIQYCEYMLVNVLWIPTCHRATTTSAGVRWSPTLGWSRRPTASRARTTGTGWWPWASGTQTTWGRRVSPKWPGCSVFMSNTQGDWRISARFKT